MRKYCRVRQPECFIANLFNEAAIDLRLRREQNIAMDRVELCFEVVLPTR